MKSKRTKLMLLAVLSLVFIFLRLYTDKPLILLGSDNVKFFELAKRFPYHTLYNDELYLLHPPFYPYLISLLSPFFSEKYIAAIAISFVSAIITFFILYKFLMMVTKNFYITFFTLLFFTLSNGFIFAAKNPLRESFVVMLFFAALYFYVKGVKFNDKKPIIYASILGGITALTTDFVVFLLPAFALSYIIFNNKKIEPRKLNFPNFYLALAPIAITLLAYGSWNTIKYHQYSTHEYYANGYTGMPLKTNDLSLLKTISPQLFEDYKGPVIDSGIASTLKRFAFNLGYMLNMEPFSVPRGLNFSTMEFLLKPHHIVYMLLIYLPLALIALYGFLLALTKFFKTREIHHNVDLYMLGLFIIFAFPITQKFVNPRYLYTAYIPLFYFIGLGIHSMAKKRDILRNNWITVLAVVLLLLIIPFWHYNYKYLTFSVKPKFQNQNTGDWAKNNIPRDAVVMAQAGYPIELIYFTGNRVIGLYHNPEELPKIINLYNVSYIVVGKRYTDYYHITEDSVKYVRNNLNKFKLVATIKEDYSDFFAESNPARYDEVYVYKVIK